MAAKTVTPIHPVAQPSPSSSPMKANLQPVWYVDSAELKQMLFPQAAEVWLATRTPYIATKTFHEYELNIHVPLSTFFGQTKLGDIGADQIRGYQQMRLQRAKPEDDPKISDTGFEPLRSDPRFKVLEARLRPDQSCPAF